MQLCILLATGFLAATINSAPSPAPEVGSSNVLPKLLDFAKRNAPVVKRDCCSSSEALICALDGALSCYDNPDCDWAVTQDCRKYHLPRGNSMPHKS